MWEVKTTNEFDAWFAGLDGDAQVELIAKVNLLKVFGPRLARPHADTLNGSKHSNMKELRADTTNAVIRVAFAFDPDRAGLLLIGGNKSGVGQMRFYKQLIARADALFDAHLVGMKSKRKNKER